MAKQTINIGSSANDGTGSSLRAGGDLINDNFNEIYTAFGDGSTLSSGFITASSSDTLTNKSGNNSQWTNDAGYINEAAQTIHTNAIGNAIDFSARVTLDGGVAEGTSGIIKNLQNIL